jgi:hypothetical protein
MGWRHVIPVKYFRDNSTGELRLAKVDHASELSEKDPNLIAAGKIAVRVARLPYGFAEFKRGKKETEAHHRFDIGQSRRGMTFVRAGREIETVDAFPRSKRDIASGLGSWPLLQSYAHHWGIEVKFDPGLDEVFGITNDKQRVRPIEDFWRLLSAEEIDRLLREENRWQSNQRAEARQPKAEPSVDPTPAETAAAAANTIAGRPSCARSSEAECPQAARGQSADSIEGDEGVHRLSARGLGGTVSCADLSVLAFELQKTSRAPVGYNTFA